MSEKLQRLLKEYNRINEETKQLPRLKAQILQLIKHEGLEKTKFNMGNGKKLVYSQTKVPEGLSQKLIQRALREHYPSLDAKQVTKVIAGSRSFSVRETIKYV